MIFACFFQAHKEEKKERLRQDIEDIKIKEKEKERQYFEMIENTGQAEASALSVFSGGGWGMEEESAKRSCVNMRHETTRIYSSPPKLQTRNSKPNAPVILAGILDHS